MGISCKGTCNRYKISKINGRGRYSFGQKRCNECGIFIKWEGIFCPCCGCRLRLKPRNSKYKEKFFATIKKRKAELKTLHNQ